MPRRAGGYRKDEPMQLGMVGLGRMGANIVGRLVRRGPECVGFDFKRGFCLMMGGPEGAVRRLDPIFATIAPGVEGVERTAGRRGAPTAAEQGYLHCGPAGAGHFVKMVHNGIEYALMASYAEGL